MGSSSSGRFRVEVNTDVLQRLVAQTPQRLDAILRGCAEQIVGDIKVSMGSSPPGRAYQRGRVTHIASRPGYPPNPDTGALRASMRWARLRKNLYAVHDGVEYGAYLELGTWRMAARPFITPVFEEWRRRKFVDALEQLI